MPEPREFRIIQSMQSALKAISVAGGYHYDVQGLAVKLDPEHEVEKLIPGADPPVGPPRPWIVLELPPDTFEYPEAASGLRVRLPFVVHVIHDSDPTDDDAKLRTFMRLCADVETALALDITRGGLATDTRLQGRQMRDRESHEVWAQLAGQVRVYRTYGAPNA